MNQTLIWPNNGWSFSAFILTILTVILLFFANLKYPGVATGQTQVVSMLKSVGVLPQGTGSAVVSLQQEPLGLEATMLIRVPRQQQPEPDTSVTAFESFLVDIDGIGVTGWSRSLSETISYEMVMDTTTGKEAKRALMFDTYLYVVSLDKEVTDRQGDRPLKAREKLKELFPDKPALVVLLRHPPAPPKNKN
jgi:hypothetical protein